MFASIGGVLDWSRWRERKRTWVEIKVGAVGHRLVLLAVAEFPQVTSIFSKKIMINERLMIFSLLMQRINDGNNDKVICYKAGLFLHQILHKVTFRNLHTCKTVHMFIPRN